METSNERSRCAGHDISPTSSTRQTIRETELTRESLCIPPASQPANFPASTKGEVSRSPNLRTSRSPLDRAMFRRCRQSFDFASSRKISTMVAAWQSRRCGPSSQPCTQILTHRRQKARQTSAWHHFTSSTSIPHVRWVSNRQPWYWPQFLILMFFVNEFWHFWRRNSERMRIETMIRFEFEISNSKSNRNSNSNDVDGECHRRAEPQMLWGWSWCCSDGRSLRSCCRFDISWRNEDMFLQSPQDSKSKLECQIWLQILPICNSRIRCVALSFIWFR